MKRLLAILIFIVSSAVTAGPLEDGLAAIDRGEYDLATKLLLPLANQGSEVAQFGMGEIHVRSTKYNDGLRTAQKWYRLSAEQGFPPAQFRLGVTYEWPLFKNYEKAAKWYTAAAEQGHTYAMLGLAHLLDHFEGLQRNPAEAAKWYRRAADLGNVEAYILMGSIYSRGRGVPKDAVESTKWYRLAAESGHIRGYTGLSNAYTAGRGVPKDIVRGYMWMHIAAEYGDQVSKINRETMALKMSSDQIAEAERLAIIWMADHPTSANR